jgi:general secretion pathway protein A
MYEAFYGLKEKPFNLTPDPDYLYMSPGHENAYTHLEYAIQESKGFVVVTGEVGSGKTTLINYLLRKIPQAIHVGIINNTFVQPQELLKMICNEFEIQFEDSDKTMLLTRLYDYLLEQFSKRERVVLIIDEAQNLSEKTLEEIRMLSNLESEKHHLIQMILVGQPQLKEKLQRKSLEQFVQRVTVNCHLDALDKNQVEGYIRHRLTVAGAQNLDIFDPEAMRAIYKYSCGIPRLINTICDTAFVYGYADDVRVIGSDLIEAVAQARSLAAREDTQKPFPEGYRIRRWKIVSGCWRKRSSPKTRISWRSARAFRPGTETGKTWKRSSPSASGR